MTGKKLLLFTFIQWIILALLKYWFFSYTIFSDPGIQEIVFWVLTGVVVTAMIRRFGVLSYLEVIFILFLWTIFNLLFDLLWLSPLTGVSMFGSMQYWIGVLILGISAFLFHKIRHIHVRHASHNKH